MREFDVKGHLHTHWLGWWKALGILAAAASEEWSRWEGAGGAVVKRRPAWVESGRNRQCEGQSSACSQLTKYLRLGVGVEVGLKQQTFISYGSGG